jgi:hypothetical protein
VIPDHRVVKEECEWHVSRPRTTLVTKRSARQALRFIASRKCLVASTKVVYESGRELRVGVS